jgi:hypothetical protein
MVGKKRQDLMGGKNVKIFILALLFLFSFPAQAEWSKPYDLSYVMGDGDNRASARQAALEQIKLKASSEAGTYVQNTTTLHENGVITDNIQLISAAMVKLVVFGEKLTVNQAGQAVLWIKAIASLDESELARRVDMLQQDKERARQVSLLQAENNALRQDYEQIRKALAGKSDQSKTAELLARQDSTIKRMADNGRTLTQVFERGTLLQLAIKNSDAFEHARQFLDEKFYAPLLQTPVTAEVESVEADGKGYVALVRVGWTVDIKGSFSVLERYLHASRADGGIRVHDFENEHGKGPNVLSERIYKHLAKNKVDLKLKLAGREVRLPIFYADSSFFHDCSNRTESEYAELLCLVSQNKTKSEVSGQHSLSNPIRIHLTREEAERATAVEASLVRN